MPNKSRSGKSGLDALSAAERSELAQRAKRIKATLQKSLIEVGRELTEAKKTLNWGQFLDWIEREVDMRPRTAQLIMRAYKLCLKHENFSHLGRSALYILGAADLPAATLAAVERQIAANNVPTYSEAKALVRKHEISRPSPVSVTLAMREVETPPAQIVNLKEAKILRDVETAIANADPNLRARVEQFDVDVKLTRIAIRLAELVDHDRIFQITTLLRGAPDATLAELATALEAVPSVNDAA